MSDRNVTLSRRRLLGGVATLVAGAAATGAGTYAVFSDTESASGSITAGSLDLEVVSQNGETYSGGPGSVTFLDEGSVVPGDSGTSTVTLKNVGSLTGYLDIEVLSVTNAENGLTDPEEDAGDDSEEGGELAGALDVQASVSGPRGDRYLCPSFSGSAPLSSVFVAGEIHSLNYELRPGETITFHLHWSVPASTGNEIQTDSVGLELAFQFDQSPDDDGTASCQEEDSDDGSDDDDDDGSDDDDDDDDDDDLDDRLEACGLGEDTLASAAYDALTAATENDAVRTVDSSTQNIQITGEEAVILRTDTSANINTTGGGGVFVVCGPDIDATHAVTGNINATHIVLNAASVDGNLNNQESVSVLGDATVTQNASLNKGLLSIADGASLTIDGGLTVESLEMGQNATLEVHKNTNGGSGTIDVHETATVTVHGQNDNAGIETEDT